MLWQQILGCISRGFGGDDGAVVETLPIATVAFTCILRASAWSHEPFCVGCFTGFGYCPGPGRSCAHLCCLRLGRVHLRSVVRNKSWFWFLYFRQASFESIPLISNPNVSSAAKSFNSSTPCTCHRQVKNSKSSQNDKSKKYNGELYLRRRVDDILKIRFSRTSFRIADGNCTR